MGDKENETVVYSNNSWSVNKKIDELSSKIDRSTQTVKKSYTDLTTYMNQADKKRKRMETGEEKVLLTWREGSRPFMNRSRDFWVRLLSISFLLGVILFIIEGPMPVILMASLIFLFWTLTTVKPEEVDYQITSYGVRFAGKLTEWEDMGSFWFAARPGAEVLVFELFKLPGRLELVFPQNMKEEVEKTVSKYLVHEEVAPNALDKVANWASRYLPKK